MGFVLFTNGNIISGINGVDYDQPASGFTINVNNGLVFDQFIEMIGMSLHVDVRAHQLEVLYRHPNILPSGSVKYMSISIHDEQAMQLMFAITMPIPNLVHLYVNVKEKRLSVDLNERVEPSTCNQYVDPEAESVAPATFEDCDDQEPGHDGEDMVVDNRYRDFRTDTDDEFEELNFDNCEHEVPETMFTTLDMTVIDSIREHDPLDVPVSMDETQLHKGMIFETKEMLQQRVKYFSLQCHAQYEVVESSPIIWSIRCTKWEDGCKWRLRGRFRQCHGFFEITKYGEQHTCFYSGLSQTHVQLDSKMLALEFCETVREKPSISVSQLQSDIKSKFGYHVPYHRVWDGKRKALAKVFGDWDESYHLLPRWLYMVKVTNPGTCLEWRITPTPTEGHVILTSVFWAFGPCIEAFHRCRPVIQIDGTHLYGKY